MAEFPSYNFQRHLELLRAASLRLAALTDFTKTNMDRWTPEQSREYARLKLEWQQAAEELEQFDATRPTA